jgi:hypothetical protein
MTARTLAAASGLVTAWLEQAPRASCADLVRLLRPELAAPHHSRAARGSALPLSAVARRPAPRLGAGVAEPDRDEILRLYRKPAEPAALLQGKARARPCARPGQRAARAASRLVAGPSRHRAAFATSKCQGLEAPAFACPLPCLGVRRDARTPNVAGNILLSVAAPDCKMLHRCPRRPRPRSAASASSWTT